MMMGQTIAAGEARAKHNALYYVVIFLCFFVSGFCSLLYQVLWTRLAFAHFGVIIPVLSITVSTFMLGLGLGSFYGGRFAHALSRYFNISPLLLYAGAEILVAAGAFAVPVIFAWGSTLLAATGAMSSVSFLLLSGVFITLALLPWCIAMGATIPLMMGFVRQIDAGNDDGFSLLYLANVLGAASGAALTAIALIEIFGLHGTDMVGAAGNIFIAVLATATAFASGNVALVAEVRVTAIRPALEAAWLKPVLFMTGFSSLGMEVCWARDFTLQLKTSIYAFAAILTVYLLATFAGSSLYKSARKRGAAASFERLAVWLFPLSLLPIYLTDPRLPHHIFWTPGSIIPLCAVLGYTTPALIDRFAHGDPRTTGRLYAVNIAGGVLGPLVAGYLLLPEVGIRWSIILFALPLAVAWLLARGNQGWRAPRRGVSLIVVFLATAFIPRCYDEAVLYGQPNEVHRDYATSVIAYGTGMHRQLMVNGVGITALATMTKTMAHLPMALQGAPHSALDICFGMGTTFRALTSWGVNTTVVDLSPAVISAFSFYHDDTAAILANPKNQIVADDGRRFLVRTNQQFDVITIDPPPPVGASGSSLLYSPQFYAAAKRRLAPGGILAQWVPQADAATDGSIALSLTQSFPYVRAFKEDGLEGYHFMASMTPIPVISAAIFVQRMPVAAQRDMVEWEPGVTPLEYATHILGEEVPLSTMLPQPGAHIPPLTDDRPYNEYFLLRIHNMYDAIILATY
jgi:spermidine synthase